MTYMNTGLTLVHFPAMLNQNATVVSEPLAAGNLGLNPLYKEVKIRLIRGLAAGEWKAGEAIPSEARLAERFNVSIGTIRKAIDELVAERILVRQQGRGTFVATHTEDRTLFYFFHIVGKDGSRELPTSELLSFRASRANAVEEARLQLSRSARILRAENVLKLGGRPVVLDQISVPAALFPDLDDEAFRAREGTIYGLYQARYGISVIRIRETLSAESPPKDVCRLLEIAPGAPGLMIKRVAFSYDDTPVEYRVSWVNTARHEYLSDLWKDEGRTASR